MWKAETDNTFSVHTKGKAEEQSFTHRPDHNLWWELPSEILSKRIWAAELVAFGFCRRHLGKGWEFLRFEGCSGSSGSRGWAGWRDGGFPSARRGEQGQPWPRGVQTPLPWGFKLFCNSTPVRNFIFNGNKDIIGLSEMFSKRSKLLNSFFSLVMSENSNYFS